MMTIAEVPHMARATNPDTSHAAANRAVRGTKGRRLKDAIQRILRQDGPLTAREVFDRYDDARRSLPELDWPDANVYDIRRRMTDLKRIDKLIVDTGRRRDGEAVMAIASTP